MKTAENVQEQLSGCLGGCFQRPGIIDPRAVMEPVREKAASARTRAHGCDVNARPARHRAHGTLTSLPGPWGQLPDCLRESNQCRDYARPCVCTAGHQHLYPHLIPMSKVPCFPYNLAPKSPHPVLKEESALVPGWSKTHSTHLQTDTLPGGRFKRDCPPGHHPCDPTNLQTLQFGSPAPSTVLLRAWEKKPQAPILLQAL